AARAGRRAALGAPRTARGWHALRSRPCRRRARRDEEHLGDRDRTGVLRARVARPRPGRGGPSPRRPARRDEGPPRAVGPARRPGRPRPGATTRAAAPVTG